MTAAGSPKSPAARAGTLYGQVRPAPADSVVHLVREHALRSPAAVAVESSGSVLTFAGLWHRTLVIADALAEAGVGPGDRVVVRADRTPGVIAAALAVMTLRAVYVPVDPTHPAERIATVLAACAPAALVHDGTGFPEAGAGGGVPAVDVADLPDLAAPPEPGLPRPEDIAYAIFTSGSTGVPKGVLVEHASLVNYVGWCGSLVGRSAGGSPLFGSLGFDLAMTSLWVPLAQGNRVVTVAGVWDQDALFGPRAQPYTFIKQTPSHARFFEVLAEPPVYGGATRALMFGGEGLDPVLLRTLAPRLGGVRLINHYGPTETTIGACAHVFDRGSLPDTPTVPIGRPAWNTRAHVVDDQLRPVPPGVAGELVIAGRAVAAGYLGGRGGDRFVDEADLGLADVPGRAYRTGDVVERLDSGALLYLGRRDDQLKVSGHRVELGELRHHVLAVPGVVDAAFEVVRGPVDTLEAFVVPAEPWPDAREFADRVRISLGAVLPSVLVPNEVHVVARLLVDANGKRDVRATRRRLAELARPSR
ncbi:amino acid adenylation domain-containing protein [Streptomyces sp. NBC_00424]|uniref:amino acid adenylation domain-containing protein n=1 Tax=Streptomyces sp. NBC_00424 TaxID=2903648 RepID=UPI00225999B2|nr:amino acid adenylation domain-containing protein [Streptomyces sp. NBC_00424]MCX5077887.1 amino acid adenylation domain-containing protein [Streptomyces sp. NBC_00424]